MKLVSFIITIILASSVECSSQEAIDDFPDFTKSKSSVEDTTKIIEIDYSRVLQLLNSATIRLCLKDTTKSIGLLNSYINEFADSGLDRLVKIKLGQLYTETGNLILAEETYNSVLSTKNTKNDFLVTPKDIENCKPLIKISEYREAKSNACLGLYKLSMLRNDNKKALEYLNLSITKYFPYTGCGNGDETNELFINKHFVEYYASIGDTKMAINKALDMLLHDDNSRTSREVAGQLRSLLLRKYTEKEIFEEIEKGISNIYRAKYIEKGEEKEKIYFTLFGRNIDRINIYSGSNEVEIRGYLRKFVNIKFLKEGKY
jgi:hypothetical protein